MDSGGISAKWARSENSYFQVWKILYWLVVGNMNFIFHNIWEFHNPN